MSPSPSPRSFQAGILPPSARGGLIALVVCAHLGVLWAVMQVAPPGFAMTEHPPMTVRVLQPEPPAETAMAIPVPEDTPPPVLPPEIETMVPEPAVDLPPPVFPLPVFPKVASALPPRPAVPKQAPPAETPPQETSRGLRTVSESQVSYVRMPNPLYPEAAQRAGQSGSTLVKVLIDSFGAPADAVVEKSSTHPLLDEEALRTVRLALFKPYLEDGLPQPVWVLVPVHFIVLRQR